MKVPIATVVNFIPMIYAYGTNENIQVDQDKTMHYLNDMGVLGERILHHNRDFGLNQTSD